jgi:hypothetical protein
MVEALSSLIRPHRGAVFPALERLAPPPPDNLIAAEIESRTGPGDIVVALHGRGGAVSKAAINRLRRAYDVESAALTRLAALVVLRPPDVRHLDAALNAMAVQPSGNVGLRAAINDWYTSPCPECGRPVIVDEYIWEGESTTPARKSYRCAACRSGEGGRPVPVSEEDLALANEMDASRSIETLLQRFPPGPEHGDELAHQVLDLYTPRTLNALAAIIDRIDRDLRPEPISAALRLAVVHMLLPASRLNSYPGRVAALRIQGGRIRRSTDKQWRERNPWLLFEEGCRIVRSFVQRVESQITGPTQARIGRDIESLIDGSSNVVLGPGSLGAIAAIADPGSGATRTNGRVKLVLAQLPIHWSPENLSFAYLATSIAMGREAAATLPLEALHHSLPRGEWAWDSAVLRRSLAEMKPVMGPDSRAVVILDRADAGALVAAVLGGVAAGYRLSAAALAENPDDLSGTLELLPPNAPMPDLPPLPAPIRLAVEEPVSDEGEAVETPVPDDGWYDEDALIPALPADAPGYGRRDLASMERAVTNLAVGVLQARGEPARFERLLGEVLIGLDRLGHLRRLVGTQVFEETEAAAEQSAVEAGLLTSKADLSATQGTQATQAARTGHATQPSDALSWRDPSRPVRGHGQDAGAIVGAASAAADDPDPESRDDDPSNPPEPPDPPVSATGATQPSAPTPAHDGAGPSHGADPVSLLLELVIDELRRPDHPRLCELDSGRWWLRRDRDQAAARTPLSDRLEWSVFSLLSTSGGLSEQAFFDRIAAMFKGHDTPDAELVHACLDAYSSPDPSPNALLRTDETLRARTDEQGTLVGMLAEFGHRLGLRVWISPREQRRLYRGQPLSNLLSDVEQRVYLPLVQPGPQDALEQVDCIWYLRGKATFCFEVEWTAMVDEPILRRGARIPAGDQLVRFLVVPPERTELLRLKLARSPLLRDRIEEDNWHILKSDNVRRLWGREEASLDDLAPLLGLDPQIEHQTEQLALFG